MKPGVMKQVVTAVHALKSREGVSDTEVALFLQQRSGERSPPDLGEALERAVTEGFIQIKNNKFFPRASGLPVEQPLLVPVRTRPSSNKVSMSKRSSKTSVRHSRAVRRSKSSTRRGRKRRSGGRRRQRVVKREEKRAEVQTSRRRRRSKARRTRRKGRRHNNAEVEEHEQGETQNEGGQGGSNEVEEEED